MKEISLARQSYRSFEIGHIGLLRSSENPADGVRRFNHNGSLDRLTVTQIDATEVVEWVDRLEQHHLTPT